ncbi:MAG: AAA family ATPase, partial [Spirochaetales bacterium]|nr:AAA family ATPase [Spirochaetales bacterium]
MRLKLAVTGKGGAGKSTLSGMIARILSEDSQKVFVIDADPDMNMAT